MAGLNFYSGNRLDLLAGKLASVLMETPLPPLKSECIVLQSTGMMKWLSIQLSQKLGIWSNYSYRLPNKVVGEVLDAVMGNGTEKRFFDKSSMTWNTMALLPGLLEQKKFPMLENYFTGELNGLKAYQLSSKIVDTYDQYMTFRPEIILKWDRNEFYAGESDRENELWQREIWKLLTSESSFSNPPAMLKAFYEIIGNNEVIDTSSLPERISVFGISYLPLYHYNILRGISKYIDVSFYLFNPSMEYWYEIKTDKEIKRIALNRPVESRNPRTELYLEKGNQLLASLGKSGKDFHYYLLSSDNYFSDEECFSAPEGNSLLNIIQSDIFNMTDREESEDVSQFEIDEDSMESDSSLIINSCHSALREVEVLNDFLLGLFDSNDSLRPIDVLVMTTDIEKYSPYIGAVFNRNRGTYMEIPYSIADRSARNTERSFETFFKILELDRERFDSESVFSIISSDAVSGKFGLSDDDLMKIEKWIIDTDVNWAIDAEYKLSFSLPGIEENTWNWALDRMILGSMICSVESPVNNVLPYVEVEGNDSTILGKLVHCVRLLSEICTAVREERTIEQWCEFMEHVLEIFFEADEFFENEFRDIFRAINELRNSGGESSFAGKIPLLVVQTFLEEVLASARNVHDFIRGRVTFCEMLPMRSIPFKVICMLGMNSADFPRKSMTPSFDLMKGEKRMGDRSVRDEDRYLFLETLMSARECLYISYTGQSIKDNSEKDPSIVVNELLDYVDSVFIVKNGRQPAASDYIHKRHRLNPYSPVYFNSDNPESYSVENLSVAMAIQKSELNERPFLSAGLSELSSDEKNMTLNDLLKFLISPSEYLMRKRMGIDYTVRVDNLSPVETVNPHGLEDYGIKEFILKEIDRGRDAGFIYGNLLSAGELPHGVQGRIYFNVLYDEVNSFYQGIMPMLKNRHDDFYITSAFEEFTVTNRFYRIYDGNNIHYRHAKFKERDLLRIWLEHIILSGEQHECFSGKSVLIMKDRSIELLKVDKVDAVRILGDILGIYEDGMRKAIPLFEKSSFEYAFKIFEGAGAGSALNSAEQKFRDQKRSGGSIPGDESNRYVSKIFTDNPLNKDFEKMALRLYEPVFVNMKEIVL